MSVVKACCPGCGDTEEFTVSCGACGRECVVDAGLEMRRELDARLHTLIDEAVGKFPRTAGHSLEERLADLVKTYKEVVADRFKRNEDHIAAAVAKVQSLERQLSDAKASNKSLTDDFLEKHREYIDSTNERAKLRETLTTAKEQLFATERELEAYRALIAQADEIRSKFVGPLRPERARLDAIAAVMEVDDLRPEDLRPPLCARESAEPPAPPLPRPLKWSAEDKPSEVLKVGDTVHLTEAAAKRCVAAHSRGPDHTSVGRIEQLGTTATLSTLVLWFPRVGAGEAHWWHSLDDLLPGEPPTRRDDPRVVAAVERAKQGNDVPYVERRRPEAIGRTIPIHGQEIPIHDLPMDQHPHECNCGCHACPECCLSLRKGVVCGWCRVPAR